MKNTYILLRNNVESAPLSAEELQRIGLKATDLLWVECQSVCWQNPHEIPELRPLIAAATTTVQNNSNAAEVEQPVQSSGIVHEPVKEETPVAIKEEKEIAKPIPDDALLQMKQFGGLTSDIEFPVADKTKASLNTKYSRSLDEIKEMYIQTMEGKGKKLIELRLSPQTKKVALYAALVLSGALLMLIIKSFSSNKQTVVNTAPLTEPVAIAQAATPIAEYETDSAASPESYEAVAMPVEETILTEPGKQPASVLVRKTVSAVTPVSTRQEKIETIENNTPGEEKNNRPEVEAKASKPISADDIAPQLTLTANEYIVGSFGGIRNLKMTLQNDSRFLVEKVTVEIQYLNPEGIIVKTDNIVFKSLSPGDKSTIAVEKTKRGVKVGYKIVKIDA